MWRSDIREAANAKEEDGDMYRVMDVWKGNGKFWARGSVSASVDLIWVTLCDRKLAEELADPPAPNTEVMLELTGTNMHTHTHTYTKPSHFSFTPLASSFKTTSDLVQT